ncbi:hypothetical protein BDR03DRAFT_986965 [Suillus americanus]|nr:hypothetical protein BDR03DRAFT_986965 [Suillus americanus]
MSPHPAVRFLDPPVTNYNSMDVDDSSMGRESLDDLDDLYLGPDDDIEYDTMSAGPLDALAAIPRIIMHANFTLEDQSDPGQADDTGCLIDPDLYLGPEDDVIDVDEFPDAADPPTFDPATSEVSFSSNKLSTKLPADQPELDFKETNPSEIDSMITHTILEVFLTLPSNNYLRPSNHFEQLGQKHSTN